MGFAFDDAGMPVLLTEDSAHRSVKEHGHAGGQPQWTTLLLEPTEYDAEPISEPVANSSVGRGPALRPAQGVPTVFTPGLNGTNRQVHQGLAGVLEESGPPTHSAASTPESQASARTLHALGSSAPVPVSDHEIGALLVRVEEFTGEALADARRRAVAIVDAATQHANSIVERAMHQASEATATAAADQSMIEMHEQQAKQQAQTIVDAAQSHAHMIIENARQQAETMLEELALPFPQETIVHLCAAIEEFAEMNQALVSELTLLRAALTDWKQHTRMSVRDRPAPAVFEAAVVR